jgi:hypothetical protein
VVSTMNLELTPWGIMLVCPEAPTTGSPWRRFPTADPRSTPAGWLLPQGVRRLTNDYSLPMDRRFSQIREPDTVVICLRVTQRTPQDRIPHRVCYN